MEFSEFFLDLSLMEFITCFFSPFLIWIWFSKFLDYVIHQLLRSRFLFSFLASLWFKYLMIIDVDPLFFFFLFFTPSKNHKSYSQFQPILAFWWGTPTNWATKQKINRIMKNLSPWYGFLVVTQYTPNQYHNCAKREKSNSQQGQFSNF